MSDVPYEVVEGLYIHSKGTGRDNVNGDYDIHIYHDGDENWDWTLFFWWSKAAKEWSPIKLWDGYRGVGDENY